MRAARGFSMIEVTVAMLIVAGLMVAALETVGATASGRRALTQRAGAAALAQDLMDEIRGRMYVGAGDNSGLIGRSPAELVATTRAAFDDVDDFDGWSESVLVDENGVPLPGFNGWSRKVTVRFAVPALPATDSVTDQNVKRIEVTVTPKGGVPFKIVSLRTRDADNARP